MNDEISNFMTRHLPLPLMRDPDFGYWHPLGKKKALGLCLKCGHTSTMDSSKVCACCGATMKEVKSQMSSKNLEKIEISQARECHVQINTYKGRTDLDIRTFILTKGADGSEIGYTPKGLRIPIEKGVDVANAINTVLKREMPVAQSINKVLHIQ